MDKRKNVKGVVTGPDRWALLTRPGKPARLVRPGQTAILPAPADAAIGSQAEVLAELDRLGLLLDARTGQPAAMSREQYRAELEAEKAALGSRIDAEQAKLDTLTTVLADLDKA